MKDKNCCCKENGTARGLLDLTLKRFPSNYHKEAWYKFERVTMNRSLGSQFGRILIFLGYSIQGNHAWHITERYLNEGGPPNRELAETLFPYAK